MSADKPAHLAAVPALPARPDVPRQSERFARKKAQILAAATGILNRRGVKGMTLADVAASVDLSTTSVTYYFKKKEDLAVGCFLAGIARFEAMTDEAFRGGDPRTRLAAFLERYLDDNRRIRAGEAPPLPLFNDVRALREPYYGRVSEPYNGLFRRVRTLFQGPGSSLSRNAANARTHALLEQIFWSVAWLPRYHTEDYPRVTARLSDILCDGLAAPGAQWRPLPLEPGWSPPEEGAGQRDTFLVAATALINAQGYRGASVEKISAYLNVTKGSFYHHNEAKDDLVVACFERSFEVMRRVQSAAMRARGNGWERLCAAAAALAAFQVSERGPLLRGGALSALPESIRADMVARWTRITERFAAMIADGIGDGSIRAVDPALAAQLLHAALSAAASLDLAVPGASPADAAGLYAKPFLMGIFAD